MAHFKRPIRYRSSLKFLRLWTAKKFRFNNDNKEADQVMNSVSGFFHPSSYSLRSIYMTKYWRKSSGKLIPLSHDQRGSSDGSKVLHNLVKKFLVLLLCLTACLMNSLFLCFGLIFQFLLFDYKIRTSKKSMKRGLSWSRTQDLSHPKRESCH